MDPGRQAPTFEPWAGTMMNYVPKDKLTEALVMGTPVQALCGKVWVPSRDPERYPVCPECKDRYEEMQARQGGHEGE